MTAHSTEPLQLKTFPSGYLGNPNVPQTEALSDLELRRRLLNPAEQFTPDETRANQDVTQLWGKVVSGAAFSGKSDWCEVEEAIRIVKHAYGMNSLYSWAQVQKYGNAFTHLNLQHLVETVEYVAKDRMRMHSVPNWQVLLSENGKRPARFDEVLAEVFDTPQLRMMSISEFITLWCRKPAGFIDMLGTTFLMFGKY